MAELQAKFVYDELTIADLERSLSLERLGPYLDLADGDRAYALLLYEWNIRVSEAMYSILQGFEVTLRNSIHDVMCIAHGRHDWYDVASLWTTKNRELKTPNVALFEMGARLLLAESWRNSCLASGRLWLEPFTHKRCGTDTYTKPFDRRKWEEKTWPSV